jgi:hypothetical protein
VGRKLLARNYCGGRGNSAFGLDISISSGSKYEKIDNASRVRFGSKADIAPSNE